jgi:hypothetical protein
MLVYGLTVAYLTTLVAGCSKKEEPGGIFTLPKTENQSQTQTPTKNQSPSPNTTNDSTQKPNQQTESLETRTKYPVPNDDSLANTYTLDFDSTGITAQPPTDSMLDTTQKPIIVDGPTMQTETLGYAQQNADSTQKDTIQIGTTKKDTTRNLTIDTIITRLGMDSATNTASHDSALNINPGSIPNDIFADTASLSDSAKYYIDKYKKDSCFIIIEKLPEQHYARMFVFFHGDINYIFAVTGGTRELIDKDTVGDSGSPEGLFTIMEKVPKSMHIDTSGYDEVTRKPITDTTDLFKALRLNYPLLEDAERGLQKGYIDQKMYNKIKKAHEKGKMPPQNTKLGNRILVHGGNWGSIVNWSEGCYTLNNGEMQIIYDAAYVGMHLYAYTKK